MEFMRHLTNSMIARRMRCDKTDSGKNTIGPLTKSNDWGENASVTIRLDSALFVLSTLVV